MASLKLQDRYAVYELLDGPDGIFTGRCDVGEFKCYFPIGLLPGGCV